MTTGPAVCCAVLAETLHFPATPTSSCLQGFDLEVSVVHRGQAHKQSDHTHIRKCQITASSFFVVVLSSISKYLYIRLSVQSRFDGFHHLTPSNRFAKRVSEAHSFE